MATLRCGSKSIFERIGALFRLIGAMFGRMTGK
jgi:hypothetical protein